MIFAILSFINTIFEGLYKEAEEFIDFLNDKLCDLLGAILYLFLIPFALLNKITEYPLRLCETHRNFLKNRKAFWIWYKEHKEELDK